MWKSIDHARLALLVGGCAFSAFALAQEPTTDRSAKPGHSDVAQHVRGWPEDSQKAATAMSQKYGAPDEMTPTRLIWLNNGPWKQTIVYKEAVDHRFPVPHKDVLEQFVAYRVPPDKFDELANYDGSVIAERTKGEISARCDKEPMNLLALNLTHDIVEGKRSVEEARQFYAKTAMEVMQGKMPSYVQKLQFSPSQRTADADAPVMKADQQKVTSDTN